MKGENLKILVLGDIIGRIGREAIKKELSHLIKKHKPDLVVGNAENLTHGKGVNRASLDEMREAGINVFTSGNHIWNMKEGVELLSDDAYKLIRPANYPDGVPGKGARIVTVGTYEILIINLLGQVFLREDPSSPFAKLDEILLQYKTRGLAGIVVDFHAEATSEKTAFGWHADGRVSAVWGTHTHVPTADARILTQGTAYISDVGMTGAYNSVIGVVKEPVVKQFITQLPQRFEIPEEGEAIINGLIITINPKTAKAENITTIQHIVSIP